MTTVAERLRQEDLERERRMTAAERVTQSLALGERVIELYAAAHRLERDEARRRLERAGQAGRLPSRVMREIIG